MFVLIKRFTILHSTWRVYNLMCIEITALDSRLILFVMVCLCSSGKVLWGFLTDTTREYFIQTQIMTTESKKQLFPVLWPQFRKGHQEDDDDTSDCRLVELNELQGVVFRPFDGKIPRMTCGQPWRGGSVWVHRGTFQSALCTLVHMFCD